MLFEAVNVATVRPVAILAARKSGFGYQLIHFSRQKLGTEGIFAVYHFSNHEWSSIHTRHFGHASWILNELELNCALVEKWWSSRSWGKYALAIFCDKASPSTMTPLAFPKA